LAIGFAENVERKCILILAGSILIFSFVILESQQLS